jgi:tetrahydromethanopterin S-methyltransferase subunit G
MSEVESLLRRVQAAEDKLEGIQDRIDRLERLVEILRKENK